MLIIPIKTRVFSPPQDDIFPALAVAARKLKEKDVLVVTSKVVAIDEGRAVPASTAAAKRRLVLSETESHTAFGGAPGVTLSLKGHAVIASAGIDDSNGNGYWILWPKHPMRSAKKIWEFARKKSGLKRLGIIITDSYCMPMRSGTTGISIGFYGFHPVVSHIGKRDLFGRRFIFSKSNRADGIAAAAVGVMGETDEHIPVAIVRDIPNLVFTSRNTARELFINPKKDIYYPILKPFHGKKK
ncbi:MAG: coenzyme F420-0:L-glutamate ligase [Patescibacteria group bacterium]